MDHRKIIVLALALTLALAALSPAACAAGDGALGDFIDRYGPLLGDGLDALTDWLDGKTEKLAPELRETLRGIDTDDLLPDLAALAGESAGMDDAQLREAILALAERHGVRLVDAQVAQLMKLCRTLEKLDAGQIKERVGALRDALDGKAPGGLRGAWEAVKRAFTDAADWISRTVGKWFK